MIGCSASVSNNILFFFIAITMLMNVYTHRTLKEFFTETYLYVLDAQHPTSTSTHGFILYRSPTCGMITIFVAITKLVTVLVVLLLGKSIKILNVFNEKKKNNPGSHFSLCLVVCT